MATRKAATPKPAAADGAAARKTGRPSKYKDEFAGQAAKLCKLGATDAQLADFFGVAISTVALWKVEHPAFSDALRVAKEAADERVEQALYRRALGYQHDEIDIRVVGNMIVKTPVRKHYAPDAASMIFWLKNRQPAKWRQTPPEGDEGDEPAKTTVVFEIRDGRKHAQPEPSSG